MDFRVNNIEALHWLWLVAAAAAVIAAGFALRRRDLNRLADGALLPALLRGVSVPRRIVRAALVLAALVLLVAALLDPRWGVTFRQVQQRGVDLVIVLDVSKSMLAEDVAPNRLERAKQYIGDLVDRLGGDRVALVTFAGAATLKCPLTSDHSALRLALSTVTTSSAPRGGSLLGDALRVAGSAFTDEIRDHKAIVVLSDGEDHGSYPTEAAADLAERRGTPVYTVGIGDAGEGARIPTLVDGQRVYLTHEGREVWTRMDPDTLGAVALATGGAFIPVGTGTADIGRIYEQRIEPVAKREFETATVRRSIPRFQWFAGAALLLLLIETWLGDRRPEAEPALREVIA